MPKDTGEQRASNAFFVSDAFYLEVSLKLHPLERLALVALFLSALYIAHRMVDDHAGPAFPLAVAAAALVILLGTKVLAIATGLVRAWRAFRTPDEPDRE